jgi:hypothetical protein
VNACKNISRDDRDGNQSDNHLYWYLIRIQMITDVWAVCNGNPRVVQPRMWRRGLYVLLTVDNITSLFIYIYNHVTPQSIKSMPVWGSKVGSRHLLFDWTASCSIMLRIENWKIVSDLSLTRFAATSIGAQPGASTTTQPHHLPILSYGNIEPSQ